MGVGGFFMMRGLLDSDWNYNENANAELALCHKKLHCIAKEQGISFCVFMSVKQGLKREKIYLLIKPSLNKLIIIVYSFLCRSKDTTLSGMGLSAVLCKSGPESLKKILQATYYV